MADQAAFQNPNIVNFIKRNHIAVLATANKETVAPHAATIYYTVSSNLNLFFLTKEGTTKSKNITTNPQVALAIFEPSSQSIVQISGLATRIDDQQKIQTAFQIMTEYSRETSGTDELPISKVDAGGYMLYKIEPLTVRLAEYKYGPKNDVFDVATPAGESLE